MSVLPSTSALPSPLDAARCAPPARDAECGCWLVADKRTRPITCPLSVPEKQPASDAKEFRLALSLYSVALPLYSVESRFVEHGIPAQQQTHHRRPTHNAERP